MRFLRSLGHGLVILALALATLWAAAALFYDLPFPALRLPVAILYALAMFGVLFIGHRRWRARGICLLGFLAALGWWFSLKPSNDRPWQPDVAQLAWSESNGNIVTIHNVRNCDYRTETDYTPRWETRTVDVSTIRGADLFLVFWGSPWIAHTILSFQYGANEHLAFSIETRKVVGQDYSAVRGFFRQYELIYTVADERDVVRLRTNYRKGEEVYLYHLRSTPERARAVFLDYLKSINSLHDKPEWYNAMTSNCTTNIRVHVKDTANGHPQPWDYRILLNGHVDQMAYQRGRLAGDLPFEELRRRAHINPAAQAADSSPDFSRLIRVDRPGF
jgi:hypothetical protein